jgi:hypothetical protein
MNQLGWLVLLIACATCDALPFESSIYPTDTNSRNCVLDPSICGAGQLCDPVKKSCVSTGGNCVESQDCSFDVGAFCNAGKCDRCDAVSPSMGDANCATWAAGMNRTPSDQYKTLCISGICKECRTSQDCKQPGKSICDETKNVCIGCQKDDQCPSRICKIDESVLAAGDTNNNIGECVAPEDIAYVDKTSPKCDDNAMDAGPMDKPFCQIQGAIDRSKTYIRVLAGTDYGAISVSNARRAVIYGLDKNAINVVGARVTLGGRLTLKEIGIKPGGSMTGAQCDAGGRLTLRRVLISSTSATGGVRADQCGRAIIESTKVDGILGHGIWISGGSDHRVVNSTIIRSGAGSGRAALRIGQGVANSIFAFNTITGSNVEGVVCEEGQTITDSIIQGNVGAMQVSGCNMSRVVTMGAMLLDASSGGDPRVISDSSTMPVVVDKGMQLPSPAPPVTEDYFGNPRPAGGGLDIGFHEFR